MGIAMADISQKVRVRSEAYYADMVKFWTPIVAQHLLSARVQVLGPGFQNFTYGTFCNSRVR